MTFRQLVHTHGSIDFPDLLKRCMGNRPFAQRILQAFTSQLSADLDELDSALLLGDAQIVANVAHRIKGASSNVSATRLCQIATSIGLAAKDPHTEDLSSWGLIIREELQSVLEAIQDYLTENP